VQTHVALAAIDQIGPLDIALHDDVRLIRQAKRIARYRHVLAAGAAAVVGEGNKRRDYAFLEARSIFVPVAIETSGYWAST